MTFHDDRATRIQGRYAIDLTPPERSVLRAGLHEWLGPARCTDAVAVTIGFADWEEFHAHIHPLIVALDHSKPLAGQDWRRVLISAEVSFGSDLLGCGVDWPTVTGLSDLDTIALLRGLQRKLAAVVRGHGPGNSGCVNEVDQTA